MPLFPRVAFRAKSSRPSMEHAPSSGKENECPSSAAARNRRVIFPKRRASLSSNVEVRQELATVNARPCQSTRRPAIAQCFSSKKPQFHVHCDEIVKRPRRASATEATANDRAKREPILKVREPSRKCSPSVFPRKDRKVLPSKIPRPVSGAAGVERTVTNDRTVILKQAKLPVVVVEKVECATTDGDRDQFAAGNVDSIDSIVLPRSTSTPRSTRWTPFPASVRLGELRLDATPRWRESAGSASCEERAASSRKTTARSSFAGELACNADYHADLPIVEREREERAPRLSASFLKQHVNAEQRVLVVAFMLHLGTHCRYSSRIVYQAVKLFDAAIDKIPVDTGSVQLTALCSLWIVLKTRGNFDKLPTASTMIRLAKDLYAGREDLLISFEMKILQALHFNISFADAYSLLAYHMINYKRCTDASQEQFEFLYHAGGYAIDLTLLDEQFCRTAVRLIVLAAAELVLGIVLDTANGTSESPKSPRWLFWRGLLYAAGARSSDRFQDEEIDRCRVAMLRCVLMSGRRNCRFEVVYKKYSRSRYGRIAEPFLDLASTVPLLEAFDP